jgi:branched-chain amino acid transport system permease protein
VVIFLVVLLGILCFKVLFNRVREHMTTVLIMSIAVAMVFQELLLHQFGGTYRSIPPLLRGSIEIFGTRTTQQHLLAVIVTGITLAGLWLWLAGTKIGNAIRAVSQDKETANLMGINVPRIYLIVMAVSVGLAGVAAVMMGPIFMINPRCELGYFVRGDRAAESGARRFFRVIGIRRRVGKP